MSGSVAAAKYEKACALLPERLSISALNISIKQMCEAEELRLRVGRAVHLSLPEGELAIPLTRVTGEDLEHVLDRASEYSRYAANETMRQGFLTAKGGYRIGICGSVRCNGEMCDGIENLSSLNIRIPREQEDIARPLLPKLTESGKLVSTLILSPPGGGKTTLLRDLVRLASNGTERSEPMRISLVDERGEIAAMHRGVPQLDVGQFTDVLDSCPKKLAVPMLLRSMTPQVIALDEIALEQDVDALCVATNCGVVLFATVHAASQKELSVRPVLSRLLTCGVFRRIVVISGAGRNRTYEVEALT